MSSHTAGVPWPADKVGDGIYVGSFASASRRALMSMRAAGVAGVICCAKELPLTFARAGCDSSSDSDSGSGHDADGIFDYLHVLAADDTHVGILASWPAAFEFFCSVRREGDAVLVHCAAGSSRSGSTAVAILLAYNAWLKHLEAATVTSLDSPEDVVAQELLRVQQLRPKIQPNPGFMEQLIAWQRHLSNVWPVRVLDHEIVSGGAGGDGKLSTDGEKTAIETRSLPTVVPSIDLESSAVRALDIAEGKWVQTKLVLRRRV